MRTHLRSVCLAGLAAAIGGCGGSSGSVRHYYTPEGYVQMANTLIQSGRVFYSCDNDRVELNMDPSSPEFNWYQQSYLKNDIDRFNDSQQRYADIFIIDGCTLVGVNKYAHRVPLPDTDQQTRRWDGDLLFARENIVGTLKSEGQTIAIAAPTRPLSQQDFTILPVRAPGGPSAPSVVTVAKFAYADRREAADVYAVGTNAVLKDRRDAELLGNHPLRLKGRQVLSGRIVALEDGDWIQFGDGRDTHTYQYSTRDLAGTISWAALRNRSQVRVTERNTLGFAEDLVLGLDEVYRRLSETSVPPRDLHIELTLSRTLQQELSRALGSFVERELPARTYPRRAAATMIDAFTGDVLALASYPSAAEQLDRFWYLSAGERRRLLSNQNFARHPIGSAGKPFWIAAVLNQYPFLASFTVPGHSGDDSYPTVLGLTLEPRGYEVHNHPFTVDIARGLEVSCNKLAVDLTTVSLGVRPGDAAQRLARPADVLRLSDTPMPPGDRFSLCGVAALTQPDLARYLKDETRLVQLDQHPIFEHFGRITGARMFSELAPEGQPSRTGTADDGALGQTYRASRFHLAPWTGLLDKLMPLARSGEMRSVVQASVGAVSPEAVNLSINKVDGFRAEWINLLLGGATSSWNNLQLAEAASRLVTGRDVRARLETIGRTPGVAARPASMPDLDERARRLVLHGMERVVSGADGTARALRTLEGRIEQEFPEFDAFVFGKTGTPAVQVFATRDLMRLIARMYRGDPAADRGQPRAGISYDPVQQRIAITSTGERLLDAASTDAAQRFRDLIGEMNQRPGDYRVDAGQAVPEGFPLYLRDAQLLFNEGARTAWTSKGGVFVMSVLLAPRRNGPYGGALPDCVSDATRAALTRIPTAADLREPSIGITSVIYLEDIPGTSATAVEFTRRLEGQLVAALRDRVRATGRR